MQLPTEGAQANHKAAAKPSNRTTTKTITTMTNRTKATKTTKTRQPSKLPAVTQSNETKYLIAYYYYGSRTEAYKTIQPAEASGNHNSIRVMASNYHKKPNTQLLAPEVKANFIQAAIKLLQDDGYKILTPAEAQQHEQQRQQQSSNELPKQNITNNPTPHNNATEQTEPHKTEQNKTAQGGKGVANEAQPRVIDKIDLSNKDELLQELQRRYNLTTDDKVLNEISKMIIDVQNMKKQDIIEPNKVQKKMYLPLRMCEDCPHLHMILKQAE